MDKDVEERYMDPLVKPEDDEEEWIIRSSRIMTVEGVDPRIKSEDDDNRRTSFPLFSRQSLFS